MYFDYGYGYGLEAVNAAFSALMGLVVFFSLIGLAIAVVVIIGQWKAYAKMGLPGWAVLIPIYRRYVLFKLYYGKGWKLIYEWIPFYGLYVKVVLGLRIARSFKEDGGFGWGLAFLSGLFWCILGFGRASFDHPVEDVASEWLRKVPPVDFDELAEVSDAIRKAETPAKAEGSVAAETSETEGKEA